MKFLFLSFVLLAMNHLVGGETPLEDGEVYQPNIVVSCFESISLEGEDLLGFRVVFKNIRYSRSFDFVSLSFLNEQQIINNFRCVLEEISNDVKMSDELASMICTLKSDNQEINKITEFLYSKSRRGSNYSNVNVYYPRWGESH